MVRRLFTSWQYLLNITFSGHTQAQHRGPVSERDLLALQSFPIKDNPQKDDTRHTY